MRRFARRDGVPPEVTSRAALPRGEKALAHATSADGTWLLGTRRWLVVVPPTPAEVTRVPWEHVEDASWDREGSRLTITEVGSYGEPRPAYAFTMENPALLLQMVRERVTASVVLQRRVPVRGPQGLVVIGRRSPVGGPIAWMHAYDPGLDPADPQVASVAELALERARAEVGEG